WATGSPERGGRTPARGRGSPRCPVRPRDDPRESSSTSFRTGTWGTLLCVASGRASPPWRGRCDCTPAARGVSTAREQALHGLNGVATPLGDELGALVHELLAVGPDRVDDVLVPLRAAEVVLPRGGGHLERHPGVVLVQQLVVAGL